MSKKEKEICDRIRNAFEKLFCLRSNLGNDNIISRLKARSENGYEFWRSGVKTDVENYILWSEIDSGFGLNRVAHPHEELSGVPPSPSSWMDSKSYPKIK